MDRQAQVLAEVQELSTKINAYGYSLIGAINFESTEGADKVDCNGISFGTVTVPTVNPNFILAAPLLIGDDNLSKFMAVFEGELGEGELAVAITDATRKLMVNTLIGVYDSNIDPDSIGGIAISLFDRIVTSQGLVWEEKGSYTELVWFNRAKFYVFQDENTGSWLCQYAKPNSHFVHQMAFKDRAHAMRAPLLVLTDYIRQQIAVF